MNSLGKWAPLGSPPVREIISLDPQQSIAQAQFEAAEGGDVYEPCLVGKGRIAYAGKITLKGDSGRMMMDSEDTAMNSVPWRNRWTAVSFSHCQLLRLKYFSLAVFCSICLDAFPAHANQVSVTLSNIIFTGLNACSGICKETFSASFIWDATFGTVVPATMTTSTTGPLEPFNQFSTANSSFPGIPDLIWKGSLPSTIHWIPLDNPPGWPSQGTYAPTNVSLHCQLGSEVDPCADLFGFVTSIPATTGNVTVTAVPEPSAAISMAFGILGFILLLLRQRRNHEHEGLSPLAK